MISALLTLSTPVVYAILFALIAGESSGLPLPGETSLIAASLLAARHGGVQIEVVIAIAAVAAIVGDNVGFALGRRGGRWLHRREGRWSVARKAYLERGEQFFDRHGPKAVFLARWVPGLRVVGAWLAGANKMRWRSFLLWNAVGGIAWAVSVGLVAYLLGQAAANMFKTFGFFAGAAVGVAIMAGGVVHVTRRHHARKRDGSAARTPRGAMNTIDLGVTAAAPRQPLSPTPAAVPPWEPSEGGGGSSPPV